jgi:hypothetical protein
LPNDRLVISATRPGALEVDATTYTIRKSGVIGEMSIEEWMVLDRIDGRLGHYKYKTGGTLTLALGGNCTRVEQKF